MVQEDFSSQLIELDKIQDVCRKLLGTKHYQKLGEEGIHAIIARAKALGIHPFEALNNGFFCINGRVGMSTEMMAALVRRRGHSIQKDPKSTGECVILHGTRADNGDKWTCSFNKQDAEAAGLWSTATWKKYPQIMLYNRAMSMLFRQLFSDLSLGAGYVEDELKEITRTGDYAKSLPEAESEEVKPLYTEEVKPLYIEKVQIDMTPIAPEQVKCLMMFIDGDETYLKTVLERLAKLKIMSLNEIPVLMFDKVLIDAKKNFEKREEAKMTQQAGGK